MGVFWSIIVLVEAKKMSDIIAVVTSTPSSMRNAEPALLSILSQTLQPSTIRWHLPTFCQRTQTHYGTAPHWARQYSNLEIVQCIDDGPITKVTPVLDSLRRERLVIFDDDVVYHPDTIAILDEAQRSSPDSAVGTIGHTFTYVPFQTSKRRAIGLQNGISWVNRVSVLLGTGMLMLPPGFFDGIGRRGMLELLRTDPGFFLNDDHVLAHIAHTAGIPMFVVPCPGVSPYVDNQSRLTGTNSTRALELRMIRDRKLQPPLAETIAVCITLLLLAKFCRLVVRRSVRSRIRLPKAC